MNKNKLTPRDAANRDIRACFGETDSDKENIEESIPNSNTEAWKEEYREELLKGFKAINARENAQRKSALADFVVKGSIALSITIAAASVVLMIMRTCSNNDPGKPFK